MSEPEASTLTITKARGGWVLVAAGGPGNGISVAKNQREVLGYTAESIGLSEMPKDLRIPDANLERVLILLGSIHDQMRRGALMVVGDGPGDSKRTLDKTTTNKVADDIKDALKGCGLIGD